MRKVIHLIPEDGIGGVETAARSILLSTDNNIDLDIVYVQGPALNPSAHFKEISPKKRNLNSLDFYINGLRYLYKNNPNLLVCSLWRSNIIGLIYVLTRKLMGHRNTKFVTFRHSSTFKSLPDKIVSNIAFMLADEIWCDSKASAKMVNAKITNQSKVKVISFLLKTPVLENMPTLKRKNNFVFWGRLDKVKGLGRAIKLFERIHRDFPESLFFVYGPDSGDKENLIKLVEKLDLKNNVFFRGVKDHNDYPKEILTSKFFINTSFREGMGISVTEAMQLGLIPIVNPVGEIANYCIDGVNSIYYTNNPYPKIKKAMMDESFSKYLSYNAKDYWNNSPCYEEDFIKNCLRLIEDS